MKNAMCYVGRCKCGHIVAAVVAEAPEISNKDVAKDVAQFIRDGLKIEQMSTEDVRTKLHRCTCEKPKKKALAQELLL